MRVTTSDGAFGFVIERTDAPRFFVFQLVIGGELTGDRDPCILGTAMHQIKYLDALDIDPVLVARMDAPEIIAALRSRDSWNDRSLRPLAESLDLWWVRGFICGTDVVFIAGQGSVEGEGPQRIAKVPIEDYDPIAGAVVDFWTAASAPA